MLVVSQGPNRHGFWEYMFCRQRIREPSKWKHIILKARERKKDIGRSRVDFDHNAEICRRWRFVGTPGARAISYMRSQRQKKHKWFLYIFGVRKEEKHALSTLELLRSEERKKDIRWSQFNLSRKSKYPYIDEKPRHLQRSARIHTL